MLWFCRAIKLSIISVKIYAAVMLNTNIPQQINFVEKLEEDDGAAMFFIAEKQQKTILNFSLDSLIVTEQYNYGTSKNIKFID